jgi:dTMP kinase
VNNKLIFIEGPKGVGKSRVVLTINSPTHHLYQVYEWTTEPWNTEIAYLASDEPYNIAARGQISIDPTTQAMLYTADRRLHMRYVQDWLRMDSVICDRGPLSTMVYQGLVGGVELDWLLALNGVAMEGVTVAATILLHAPFDITVQRIEGRGTPLTDQERDQLRPAWEAYESLRLGAHDSNGHLQHFVSEWKDITGWIHYIDANRPAAEVEADVIATIDQIIQGS